MNPKTLDHVAYWLADRDAVADFAVRHLGMHVIDRTDAFTLVGAVIMWRRWTPRTRCCT